MEELTAGLPGSGMRHETARNLFAFMPSKLGVSKPKAQLLYQERQLRHEVAVLPKCS